MSNYLTIIYRITHPGQPKALLEQAEWSAASHSHAIQERDRLEGQRDTLLAHQSLLELDNIVLADQRDALLKALKVVLRDHMAVHGVGDLEMQPALFQARAAIAKATGGAV